MPNRCHQLARSVAASTCNASDWSHEWQHATKQLQVAGSHSGCAATLSGVSSSTASHIKACGLHISPLRSGISACRWCLQSHQEEHSAADADDGLRRRHHQALLHVPQLRRAAGVHLQQREPSRQSACTTMHWDPQCRCTHAKSDALYEVQRLLWPGRFRGEQNQKFTLSKDVNIADMSLVMEMTTSTQVGISSL